MDYVLKIFCYLGLLCYKYLDLGREYDSVKWVLIEM